MKITRKEIRELITETIGDMTTPEQLQQHVFPGTEVDTKPTDYYHIETIVMTVGMENPNGFTVNDVFDYIYKNNLEPYTEMSFNDLHQVCIDLARDGVLEGYEDFFMMVDLG